MDSRELEKYKNIIIEMRKEVLEGLKREKRKESMRETSGSHSYSFHMADQGSDCNEQEKSFLLASMEGNNLEALDNALQRINEGTYGKCVICDKDINERRLEALPFATLCIECKSNEENKRD